MNSRRTFPTKRDLIRELSGLAPDQDLHAAVTAFKTAIPDAMYVDLFPAAQSMMMEAELGGWGFDATDEEC